MTALPDTFSAAKPVGRISDQFAPAPPFARLKLSRIGVVGPTPEFATTTAVAAEVADGEAAAVRPCHDDLERRADVRAAQQIGRSGLTDEVTAAAAARIAALPLVRERRRRRSRPDSRRRGQRLTLHRRAGDRRQGRIHWRRVPGRRSARPAASSQTRSRRRWCRSPSRRRSAPRRPERGCRSVRSGSRSDRRRHRRCYSAATGR